MKLLTNIGVEQLSKPETLDGMEVKFAGLVSGVKQNVSSKGEPYGSMVIDDYSGSYELRLFRDEYNSFKNFFIDNTYIYCRGTVKTFTYTDNRTNRAQLDAPAPDGHDEPRRRARQIHLKLTFKTHIDSIDDAFIKDLHHIARKHRGNVPLELVVVYPMDPADPTKTISLTMRSAELRVTVHDMINALEQLPAVFDIQPILRQ